MLPMATDVQTQDRRAMPDQPRVPDPSPRTSRAQQMRRRRHQRCWSTELRQQLVPHRSASQTMSRRPQRHEYRRLRRQNVLHRCTTLGSEDLDSSQGRYCCQHACKPAMPSTHQHLVPAFFFYPFSIFLCESPFRSFWKIATCRNRRRTRAVFGGRTR